MDLTGIHPSEFQHFRETNSQAAASALGGKYQTGGCSLNWSRFELINKQTLFYRISPLAQPAAAAAARFGSVLQKSPGWIGRRFTQRAGRRSTAAAAPPGLGHSFQLTGHLLSCLVGLGQCLGTPGADRCGAPHGFYGFPYSFTPHKRKVRGAFSHQDRPISVSAPQHCWLFGSVSDRIADLFIILLFARSP